MNDTLTPNHESVNLGAREGSIAPGDRVIIVQGRGYGVVPCTRVVILLNGSAEWPHVIHRDMPYAVRVETDYGNRYIGVDQVAIESDLRVHWVRTRLEPFKD